MRKHADFYAILGVQPDAPQQDIRTAFRALAKAHHPDQFPTYIQRIHATQRMQDINEAYSTLKDPERRRIYDLTRPRYVAPKSGPLGISPTAAHRETRVSSELAWGIAWVGLSAVISVFYARGIPEPSLLKYAGAFVVSLLLMTPAIVIALLSVLGPMLIVMSASFCYSAEHRGEGPSGWALARDFTLRSGAFVAVVYVFVWALSVRIEIELLYVVMLGVIASLAGEIAAMVFYMFRSISVNRKTHALMLLAADVRVPPG